MMTNQPSRENSSEIEVYGEFGLLPKVGAKIRHSRKKRFERVINTAAEHADVARGEFEDRLENAGERVLDVVAVAAIRASEVDDEVYLDALGRLIAGALDSAEIDELSYVTSEIAKLNPVHLRALLAYFFFGRRGSSKSESGLGPAEAGWASTRERSDPEIATVLNISEQAALQILSTLRRDGYLDLNTAGRGVSALSRPSEWARRVLAILFPELVIHADDSSTGKSATMNAPAVAVETQEGSDDSEAWLREHRAITELEKEIKKIERERHGPLAIASIANDSSSAWLATLKRRLRRVDPDNPWAYNDDY